MMLEKRLLEVLTDCKRAGISKGDVKDMVETLYEEIR